MRARMGCVGANGTDCWSDTGTWRYGNKKDGSQWGKHGVYDADRRCGAHSRPEGVDHALKGTYTQGIYSRFRACFEHV
eukprot:3884338-Rhodomonas_salina.1